MSFVVFLDVDGVLNTRRTCVRTPAGYTGIDEARVELLANAMKEVGAHGVILTTTWKNLPEDDEDYAYLMDNLKRFEIDVLGSTVEELLTKREEGILYFLKEHPEVDEYVILDDQQYKFELHRKLWESFLDTQGRGLEYAIAASKTPSVPAILFLDAIKKYAR